MRLPASIPAGGFLVLPLLVLPLFAQTVTTIRVGNQPDWGPLPRLVEELRIGNLDGPEESQFGMITAVTPRKDGGIYVFDTQVPVIRLFNGGGRFIRNVGRAGAGPGEYRNVQGMRMRPNSELAVWDPNNARITLFDSTGRYLRDHRLPGGAFFGEEAFGVDTAGNYYVKIADMKRAAASGEEVRDERNLPLVFLKVSPTGTVSDTIRIPLEEGTWPSFVLATPQGYRGPFAEATIHALSNGGYLVTGRNRSYAIDLKLPGGRVRRLTREATPIRLVGAERAQWQAWVRFFEGEAQKRGQGPAQAYPALPSTKPFFRGLWVDADGRIWVDRYVEASKVTVEPRQPGDGRPLFEWREPPTFDVLSPEGRFLGTVVFPRDTYVYHAQGMQVWAETKGEDGEAYVVRYRIERGR